MAKSHLLRQKKNDWADTFCGPPKYHERLLKFDTLSNYKSTDIFESFFTTRERHGQKSPDKVSLL